MAPAMSPLGDIATLTLIELGGVQPGVIVGPDRLLY